MNNKTIGVIIGAIVIVAVIGFVVAQSNTQGNPGVPSGGDATSTPTQTGGNPTSTPTSTTGTPKPGTYTLADVARHRTQSSCWTTIDGNVYDLTSWIPQHPGGEAAIVSICGKDGSLAFHNQHDDAKRQADILATFKIGTLVK